MSSSTPMPRLPGLTRRLSGALALLLLPSLASAHTSLRRSEPAKGARMAIAPTRIGLWFTARPQLAFSRIRLIGPAGDVALEPLKADTSNALLAGIPGALEPGEYRVEWQTASADGHPLRGEFTFTVLGASDTTAAAATSIPSAEPAVQYTENPSARWIEFVALLAVLGALAFRHGVLPPLASRDVPTADASDRARRLGRSALVLYAIATIVRLYGESAAVRGTASALDPTELLAMVSRTTWGVGWAIGAVGAVLLFLGWTISKRSVTIGTPLALTGALGMVLSPALTGHAAASRHFVFSVTLDVLHVAAAGAWLGGLLMVMVIGVPAMRRLQDGNTDAAVGALVSSFHPVALFCAPIVVLAGIGTSWIRLGGLSALWLTPYGQKLLVKLAFVAVVLAMGSYNALRARRRLGSPEGTKHFRWTGAIELAFAALVLSATVYLVTTPVPSEMLVP